MDESQFPKSVEVVGSAIIENNNGQILLVKSPKWQNKWVFPGGHIEAGETIAQALLREAKEEVGLKLELLKTISFGELINSKDFHRPAHFIYFDIVCKAKTEKVQLEKRELSEYIWTTPEQALTMDLAESYDQTIKKYINYKKK